MLLNLPESRSCDVAPLLNPLLNYNALAEKFVTTGRIHVPGVLARESAERVHACLKSETPYGLCLNADAQATLYRGGHFLTAHDDEIPGTNRLAAYVMSFTATWRPEWGGLLEFIDEHHNISAGYLPDFNTLKLFRIPMTQHAGMVAPFAAEDRYSIRCWLRRP